MPSIRLKMDKGFGNKQEEIDKSEFVGIGIQENIQKITHLWG